MNKAIIESCKVTRKKLGKEDSRYSHSGNEKLMFINGLTLKEFEKKYHINPFKILYYYVFIYLFKYSKFLHIINL